MYIKYNGKTTETSKIVTVYDIVKDDVENSDKLIVGATVNNEYKPLTYKLRKDAEIELLDIASLEGKRIYIRTILYIMIMAFERLYPETTVVVKYKMQNAIYCGLKNGTVTKEMIEKVSEEMDKIVKRDLPITQIVMNRAEAEKFYNRNNTTKGLLQFDLKSNNKIRMYYCEDYFNYFYGTVADRTSVAQCYKLTKYDEGFLLRYPNSPDSRIIEPITKMKKLAWALNEYDEIHKVLHMDKIYKLNQELEENGPTKTILVDEALHERNIAKIADKIASNKKAKIVLIAGPSSSGKTTFSQRLCIQLVLNKIKPVTLSVDNYFVERKDNPVDEFGEYDFETIDAVDLKLFNDHLKKLLNGETVEIPEFNFRTGSKEYKGRKIKLEDDQVLVIEGIHCLNNKLTEEIPDENKYKIHTSALTVLNIDNYNRISTTDERLIRRIARDYQFRGYSAQTTLRNWWKVKKGEQKYIIPYQEEANSIFNSSLAYELCVLKTIVKPLLEEIPNTEKEYGEAKRLLSILKYFKSINVKEVPTNSILREFTGGGVFEYL